MACPAVTLLRPNAEAIPETPGGWLLPARGTVIGQPACYTLPSRFAIGQTAPLSPWLGRHPPPLLRYGEAPPTVTFHWPSPPFPASHWSAGPSVAAGRGRRAEGRSVRRPLSSRRAPPGLAPCPASAAGPRVRAAA